MAKITFKKDKNNQLFLLPPDISDLIPENHSVRVINKVIEQINITSLLKGYKGGGASCYSPRTLLKVIIYCYIEGIYTTRRIEKALRDNINLMWLSGMSTPDHGTIHNFRSKYLKDSMEEIFASVVELLLELGFVKAENIFIDGTKIEANANRYSYIWKKNTERYQVQIREKVRGLMQEIDQLQKQEDIEYGAHNLEEIGGEMDSQKLEEVVEKINKNLKDETSSKPVKARIKKLKKEYLPKLKKYEHQQELLKGRTSCSKTDPDATFFRMKETHSSKDLKPAYNVQIATENQFILGYGVYQKAADTSTFVPFIDKLEQTLPKQPMNVIADAGYGSEENYERITRSGIGNYVKYNTFFKDNSPSNKFNPFAAESFRYDSERDYYTCPQNRPLLYVGTEPTITENGFKTYRKIYKSLSCNKCKYKDRCASGKGLRTIRVSPRLNQYKEIVRSNLNSKKGKQLRAQRRIDVESVFGHIKHNRSYRRFLTRGLDNVRTEWGIISIAHNLKKIAG
jgi:transposase